MRRAALIAAVALIAGGCGAARDSLGGGAARVPANAVSFFAARASTSADWRQLARRTLHRVPPAVPKDADEVDLAVLQGGKLIVLTHEHGTWRGGAARTPSLADNPNYRASLRALPGGTLAQAYVRGDVAAARLLQIPGEVFTGLANFTNHFRVVAHPQQRVSNAVLRWRWGAAWQTKNGLGARVKSAGLPLAQSNRIRGIQHLAAPFASALIDEIPADVQSIVDVELGPGTFSLMRKLPAQIRRRFPHADFQLPSYLDAIASGETALYTRAGGETTLVTSPPDSNAALSALAGLGLRLHHAFIGGQLVLSTRAAGISAFRGGGAKLSGDPGFEKANIPARVTAFAFERGKRAAWSLPDGPDATFTVRLSR